MYIKRTIQEAVEERFFQGRAVIIYGARQVGKTTLIRAVEDGYDGDTVFLNCDEPDDRRLLTEVTSTELKSVVQNKNLVFIDEAQRVKNIGVTLKLLVDNFPETQVVATGSSSFDLSNEIKEPLTGRKFEFHLYPFSWEELSQEYSGREQRRTLEERIIFGMYPDVVKGEIDKKEALRELSDSYLFRDAFRYQQVKSPDVLIKLLRALALQIGNEVSYNELADLVGIDKRTVERYVHILEKAFVIFRVGPYSRNLRKEISKMRKIYFWDTGVRNTLINNLNPLDIRNDKDVLWENFLISERVKSNSFHNLHPSFYFWRTYDRQEVDYLEEEGGRLRGFEFKWSRDGVSAPKKFSDAYPEAEFTLVNRDNFFSFLRTNQD